VRVYPALEYPVAFRFQHRFHFISSGWAYVSYTAKLLEARLRNFKHGDDSNFSNEPY
jgi:hypothetical protein